MKIEIEIDDVTGKIMYPEKITDLPEMDEMLWGSFIVVIQFYVIQTELEQARNEGNEEKEQIYRKRLIEANQMLYECGLWLYANMDFSRNKLFTDMLSDFDETQTQTPGEPNGRLH